MINWLKNTELEGVKVKLIPLTIAHREELLKAASDGKLWELWFTSVPSKENIDSYIAKALDDFKKGIALPFVVINKNNGELIGATRFCNAVPDHKRVEIGYTWYAKKYQRTGVNTECKYLLLKYAFEELSCIAVEFRTNWYNLRSRAAISRLGAKQDGILRNHQLNSDGSYRDTVVFSITNQEWKGVEKLLLYEMKKYT
jgi:RimJ/RimL family protein N-acetyltransferase